MKILVIKGEVHFIETDNTEEFFLLTDKEVTAHDDVLELLLKAYDGPFDEVIAYANTQEILDKHYKRKGY